MGTEKPTSRHFRSIPKVQGLQTSIAQRVIDKRLKPSPIQTLTPEVVQAQQQIADLFQQVQLIPKHIQVQSTVWRCTEQTLNNSI